MRPTQRIQIAEFTPTETGECFPGIKRNKQLLLRLLQGTQHVLSCKIFIFILGLLPFNVIACSPTLTLSDSYFKMLKTAI